jgi:hypothetical protein
MPTEGSEKSQLCLELHPVYFAFAAKQSGQELFQPIALEHQTGIGQKSIQDEQLSAWLKRYQAVWSHPYDQIFISMHGLPTTVVGTPEDAQDALSVLTEYRIDTHSCNSIALQDTWHWSIGIDRRIDNLLNSYFINPIKTPGIQGFSKRLLADEQDVMGLFITPETAYFMCIRDGKAVYYNSFPFQTKEDLLYYTLLCFNTLKLDPQVFPLTVAGLIEDDAPLYQVLYQFVKNVSLAAWPVQALPETLEQAQLKPHFVSNLMFVGL